MVAHDQPNNPTHASHDYHTADPTHQLYNNSSYPAFGHCQPHSLNSQPYSQASGGAQGYQQSTYGYGHQGFGQTGSSGKHQGYTHDGTLGQFAGSSHQPNPAYGQHSIGSSHQPCGAFSAQCDGGATSGQFGGSGFEPSASQSFQVSAHLGYQGNQASEDQSVDEMDSFIDSLFQC